MFIFFIHYPLKKNRALIETTWLSNLEDQSLMDYDLQLETYIKNNLEEIRTNYTWSKIIDDHEVLFNKLLVVKKNKAS